MTMCKCIRAGASKFLGLRRIFAQISPNLPKKLLCTFCLQIFSNTDHEDFLLCDFQKKRFLICFSANVGRHVLKSNNVGRPFCPDVQGFA